jgi:hypothetical protein
MSWLKGIWSELLSLFVDDMWFALSILIWLIACGLALPRLNLPSAFPPIMLFVGLVLILGRSALRRSGER